jgi:hypothetical protein
MPVFGGGSTDHCSAARSLSAGVSQPNVVRGRPLSWRQTLTLAFVVPRRASLKPRGRNENDEKWEIGGTRAPARTAAMRCSVCCVMQCLVVSPVGIPRLY